MSLQSFYQNPSVPEIPLKYSSVLALVKCLNSDNETSKSVRKAHLDDVRLYTGNTAKLPILIRVATDLINKLGKKALCHAPTIHQNAKTILGKRRLFSLITVKSLLRNQVSF